VSIIKLNENPTPNDCPLCGNQTNPNIGAELFLADTERIVCFDCAERDAPVLACLITFADLSRAFQMKDKPLLGDFLRFAQLSKALDTAERMFGAKWTKMQTFR
jgi:hypothetical protein